MLSFAIAAVGCDDDDAGEYVPECVEQTTILGIAEVSARGFSAQDVLDQVVGSYPETLGWTAAEGPAYYVMPDTSVALSLEISYGGGEVRYIEATHQGWCDGACAESCNSRMAIDTTLSLTTADGVLAESWSTVLTATALTEISFNVDFDPDQTQGTLSSASFVIDDGFAIDKVLVNGSIVDGSTSGSIAVQGALAGEGGGFWAAVVGVWPAT